MTMRLLDAILNEISTQVHVDVDDIIDMINWHNDDVKFDVIKKYWKQYCVNVRLDKFEADAPELPVNLNVWDIPDININRFAARDVLFAAHAKLAWRDATYPTMPTKMTPMEEDSSES